MDETTNTWILLHLPAGTTGFSAIETFPFSSIAWLSVI